MIFKVYNAVLTKYGVKEINLLYGSRDEHNSTARKIISYLLREKLHYTFIFIQQLLNYIDHSVIFYNVREVRAKEHLRIVAEDIWTKLYMDASLEEMEFIKEREKIQLRNK